ncbi:YraN family protein [uncultured Microbacterium sp.]|uniref:YraN family protein n=1 Tax=uncultured Microbacterium sp. TaxID=191216 RepID=UPI00262E3D42|nr:YraN family protein [uncultured Microbacterium sp.]
MAEKDDLGRAGEDRAVDHLTARGYRILDRNWRCRQGEIDIVAESDGVLCIVEVKTRTSIGFGHPFDAIDGRKRDRLWRLAFAWAADHPDVARRRMPRLEIIGITGADPATAMIEHLVDLR